MFTFDDNTVAEGIPYANDGIGDVIHIKVAGVGGGGCNVVTHMMNEGIAGIEFVGINTDRPALNATKAHVKLQIGEKLTGGKGAGSDPEIGRKSAEESRQQIKKLFEGTDLLFITAGMGGGTGTGAAPVVAEIARECEVLTIGVVTQPFKFEGSRKARVADEGIAELRTRVDTLIVIPNEKLRDVSPEKITLANAFGIVDGVLRQAVVSIADLLRSTNYINLDFADLRTILRDTGYAHMGVGEASGRNKVEEATTQAIMSPLMETSIRGAKRILIRVTGSPDLFMDEVDEVVGSVKEAANDEANIIFGVDFDENLHDALRVVVIATDFDESSKSESKFNFDFNHSEPVPELSEPRYNNFNRTPAPPIPPKLDISDDDDEDWKEMDKLLKDLGISGNNRQ
jgi:cell division protein FtsZ